MIAIRFSANVKVGCMEKALEMAKTFNQDVNGDYKGRIYTPAYGPPRNVLVWEDFWESIAEREAYWGKYFEKPEFLAWWDRFNELLEPGGSTEVWNVTEISF